MRASLPLGLAASAVFVGLGALAMNHVLVGVFNDDAIYLSSGLSLVQDGTYRVGFLPGAPLAGKYPPLFPALLGLFGLLLPDPPAGLPYFKALALLLSVPGFLFLAAWLRRPERGLSPPAQQAITWLTALSTTFMATVIEVMSEGLFFSLAMAALYFADAGRSSAQGIAGKGEPPRALALAGGLTLLACYTRGVGIALAAAWLLWVARARPRWALAAGTLVVLGLLPWSYWSRVYVPAHEPLGEVLPYLLSYDFHTRGLSEYLGSPEGDLPRYALLSARAAMKGLAVALLPILGGAEAQDGWAPIGLATWLLCLAIGTGALVELRRGRLYAVFVVLYVALVGVWPWFNKARFFVVAVPLLWLLGLRAIEALTGRSARVRRALLSACVGVAVLAQLGHYFGTVFLAGTLAEEIASDDEPQQAKALERSIAWIGAHTPADAVLVTNMSGPLYGIHTGRTVLPYRMALRSAAADIAAAVAGEPGPEADLAELLGKARPWLSGRPLLHIQLCPGACPPPPDPHPVRASFRDRSDGPEIRIDGLPL